MKNIVRLTLLVVSFSSSALATDKAEGSNVLGPCPAEKLCPKFIEQIDQCSANKKSKSCDQFVDTFKELVPRYDCKRSFDTAPVPAVWLCEKNHERAVELLSKLKSKKARQFFGSEALRSTLDGALAEEFDAASRKAGKKK